MNELLSDPLLPSEESPRPAGIKGVAKQVNHDGQAASKRRLSMLRGLKEKEEKEEKSALIKKTKDAKKESKKESKSVAAAAAEKESKKEIKEESTKESKKESKSVSASSAAEPEVVVLTKSQQAHAAKKASKEADAAAAKDDVKDDVKDATSKKTSVSDSSSSKSSKSSSSSSKKEVLPEGVDVPKMGTTLLPPKIGTNKIKARNIIMHQVRRDRDHPSNLPL